MKNYIHLHQQAHEVSISCRQELSLLINNLEAEAERIVWEIEKQSRIYTMIEKLHKLIDKIDFDLK